MHRDRYKNIKESEGLGIKGINVYCLEYIGFEMLARQMDENK